MRGAVSYRCRYNLLNGTVRYFASLICLGILIVAMVKYDDATFNRIKGLVRRKKDADTKPSPLRVILLAYMHTGSTFLGSVLQNHPDTYYEYEPLRSVWDSYKEKKPLLFLNGSMRMLKTKEEYNYAGADTVWNLLTCQHENLDIYTLSTHYFKLSAPLHRDDWQYYDCLVYREMVRMTTQFGVFQTHVVEMRKNRTKLNPSETLNVTHEDILHCLPLLKQKCSNASIIVNKYIRMTIQMASEILRERSYTERIKIIHLYRDPRAIMMSQVRRNDHNVSYFSSFIRQTETLCKEMLDDYDTAAELKKKYPDTLHTIRYETMQHNPVEVIKDMFEFLGLPFLESDKEFVTRELEPSPDTATWRQDVTQEHLEVIDQHCYKLYPLFRYIPLSNLEEVRNPNNDDHLF